jgi:hypothetical protein
MCCQISRLLIWRLIYAVGLLLCISVAHAGADELLQKYQSLKSQLNQNTFGIPISIRSSDKDHIMLGVVYGVMRQPFSAVKQALTSPSAWCDIVSQHLNIKACTFERQDKHCQLTFYSGRKYYEYAEDVYRLPYRFDIAHADPNYFQAMLSATKGTMGTSAYLIEVEAIPLADNSTFLHFSYTYHYNLLTSFSMNIYLSTLGSGKVGFSVTGTDPAGKPIYVGGIRGIMERNTIRFYFAIQSYLETLDQTAAKRFDARINKWFALTQRFPRQLHELDKKDYLENKQREHADQLQLQQKIQHPCTTPLPNPAKGGE